MSPQNVAVTVSSALGVSAQLAPVQPAIGAPLLVHRRKLVRLPGAAVSVTELPASTFAEHVVVAPPVMLHVRSAGMLLIDPAAYPAHVASSFMTTVSVCCGTPTCTKVAPTDVAELIVSVHGAVPAHAPVGAARDGERRWISRPDDEEGDRERAVEVRPELGVVSPDHHAPTR